MKLKFIIIALFLSVTTSAISQIEKIQHFRISTSVIFWTPTDLHLKNSNSVTQYMYPNGSYFTFGGLSGFGTSVAPQLNIKYYFNNKVGISMGFYMVHMDNELSFQETDTTFTNFENYADIPNFTLGISGEFSNNEPFRLFYETGINFIPGYSLELKYSDESSDPEDMDAEGLALGVYFKTGVNIKIRKFLYFNTAFMYSFIPSEIEYTNSSATAKTNVKTNFGGIGLQTGLSFKF